ncbi:N-acetylmuramic acid 6-phosphate etherase [Streptomyces sp. NBC_01221]|uniref:N-acetylmuramic acid 6-phosphate etherase n=1 Tax=Streptomyces sp. NBC_01221 TaxID=2903782 RepID=UPI00225343F2|nr:N-acetylmuramic acid 6-phosphate etherase [Streptomyces sp. NBC_01221]MCX4790514.1 N-acetylmuramic acid 6-phosphate etherase [Streptomyces sp. NBC_01221]
MPVRESVPPPLTELRNPATHDLDELSVPQLVDRIADQDLQALQAVRAAREEIAQLVALGVGVLRGGGRIHYFGAGCSGRFGVLDAAEVVPTFGVEPGVFVAHLAGGPTAMTEAVEDVEDDADAGGLDAAEVTGADLVIGLSASGATPYVGGALRRASASGAATALVSANPGAPLAADADLHIALVTGPEAVTGSTRMKAGTAQKLVLTAFSTAVMVRLGRTYSNLMVSLTAVNDKLRRCSVRILCEAAGVDADAAGLALAAAGGDTQVALLGLLADLPADRARHLLAHHGGSVKDALRSAVEAQAES